jgi:hypothetical protein
VSVATSGPVQLCRTLLAFTAPGGAVAVPHAALTALVELATDGVSAVTPGQQQPTALSELYDVASLSRRYGRAPATVRQWFATGLFGAAKDRLFRGRGYVASRRLSGTLNSVPAFGPVRVGFLASRVANRRLRPAHPSNSRQSPLLVELPRRYNAGIFRASGSTVGRSERLRTPVDADVGKEGPSGLGGILCGV